MGKIKNITLLQFRNYSSATFTFPEAVTCITGPNGSGKTNLLDAVYYLCYTKSYFSAWQQNSVQKGMDGFRVEGTFEEGNKAIRQKGNTEPIDLLTNQPINLSTVSCKWKQGKKEVSANGVPYEQFTDHIGRYAAVMIAPDDMELINDGSELRRKWVDSILGQADREYLERLMHYQRVLMQRNAWLKLNSLNPPSDNTELDYYDRELDADAVYIHSRRTTFLAEFMPLLDGFYHQLSAGKETIQVNHEADLAAKPLAQWLKDGLQHDLRLQRTLRGIHKDDWNFSINTIPLKNFASQGQKKSFLFALKLAQYAYLSKVLGHLPILLLDDVFEKLDQTRMEALLSIIRTPAFGQVILTDTHPERVKAAFGDGVEVGLIQLT